MTNPHLDTPFLLNALGYGGEAQREACVELLDLLYETGADLRCFAHTRDEIRGVLEACASQVQNGKTDVSPSSEVLRNFRAMGALHQKSGCGTTNGSSTLNKPQYYVLTLRTNLR